MSDLRARIMKHVVVDERTGCWLWTGYINKDGYGKIGIDGTSRGAHRIAFEEYRGTVPVGLELDHVCKTRRCVNPDHLDPVTHIENVKRGDAGRPNLMKIHCKNGHPFTPENTRLYEHDHKTVGRACKICCREAQRRYRERAA